eukprot:365716-Chlamydomonas_euryale.AAC.8
MGRCGRRRRARRRRRRRRRAGASPREQSACCHIHRKGCCGADHSMGGASPHTPTDGRNKATCCQPRC